MHEFANEWRTWWCGSVVYSRRICEKRKRKWLLSRLFRAYFYLLGKSFCRKRLGGIQSVKSERKRKSCTFMPGKINLEEAYAAFSLLLQVESLIIEETDPYPSVGKYSLRIYFPQYRVYPCGLDGIVAMSTTPTIL